MMLQLRQMCILNMATKKAKLSDFTKQTNNVNRHKPRGMGMLDSVIAKDGWQSAITVANDNQVFAGSARLEVAQERFGDESEPIVFDIDGTRPVILRRTDIPNADDPRAIRLGIADNRISEINYDPDIELLSAIADSDIDISDLYFDDELAALVAADSEGEEEYPDQKEDEDEDALEKSLDDVGKVESRVKLGEIWQLGRHKIACGDSTVESNVRALLGDRFGDVGMVWSDPPYGVEYRGILNDSQEGLKLLLTNAFDLASQAMKKGAAIYVFHSDRCADIFHECFRTYFHFSSMVVWVKPSLVLSQTDYQSRHEPCFYGWKEGAAHRWFSDRKQTSVWEYGRETLVGHTTPKPIAMVESAFLNSSDANDIIYDPFLGSAPSIIAAQKMEGDRTVYGLELSPDYCEVIIARYENFTGDIAKLIGRLP